MEAPLDAAKRARGILRTTLLKYVPQGKDRFYEALRVLGWQNL